MVGLRDVPSRNPLVQLPRNAGARPIFQSPKVCEDFQSPRVRFELRVLILVADMMYRELGAPHMKVLRILGDDPIYAAGRAADVSVLELPGVQQAKVGVSFRNPSWIAKRVSLLFPSMDGAFESAMYDGAKITLRVPSSGYPADLQPLSEWGLWGATGRVLTPRKEHLDSEITPEAERARREALRSLGGRA